MPFKKTIARIKFHIKELVKTFSSQPSLYASKRIERCIIFLNANIMLWWMVTHLMQKEKLDWPGAVAIYGAQMMYAGYQTKKIMEETKLA